MLVSCTMDDIKEVNPGQEIEFRVLTTKGEVVDLEKFKKFTVVAFKEDGTEYYTDVYEWNGVGYICPNKHMWPTDGSTVYFQAYCQYGLQSSGEVIQSSKNLTLKDFSTFEDISDQVDFISASAEGNKNTGVVELDFVHRLAQIEVRGRNTNPGYVCQVAGLRIAHVKSSGSYDFAGDTWVGVDNKCVYEVIYDAPITLAGEYVSLMKHDGDNALFIPQVLEPWILDANNDAEGVYVALLVKITTATSNKAPIYPLVNHNHNDKYDDYDWAALPLNGEWKAGNKYVYNWDIPKVGGYVYPGKEMLPQGDYASLIDNFYPGSHIMGEQIHFLEPMMFPFEAGYVKSEEDLIGVWSPDRLILTVHDDVVNVLEFPSSRAIAAFDILPEFLSRISFNSSDTFYLYGDSETQYSTSRSDGKLYLLDASDLGKIEINDWSDEQMMLHLAVEEQKEIGEGYLLVEVDVYYGKEEAGSDVLLDWERILDQSMWQISSFKSINLLNMTLMSIL